MDLLKQFEDFISKENLLRHADKLLLAVSGGVDSVVLCELCKRAGFDFVIAHCNFQLRNEESDGDEAFVKALASKYEVGALVKRFDTTQYATEKKLSIQVAARNLRYEWFSEILSQSSNPPLNYILTAHHANDNIETLLINFFKGTGIAGLQGILHKSGIRGEMIRPLLFAKREDIVGFAVENKLSWREDSSNESNKYTRNYFRNGLMPALREVYPQVEDNLLDNIIRFQDVNLLYRQSIQGLKKKLLTENKGEWLLPVLQLQKTGALKTVLFELTKEYGFTPGQANDIIHLLNGESGKYVDSASHRILRNRKWLIISALSGSTRNYFSIQEGDSRIILPGKELIIAKSTYNGKLEKDPMVAMLDAKHIQFPLLLRKWKQGDYFYPLGMKKKKKLSRFFIDQKLSITEKENTWVVEMNKKIIWIAGLRIDDRFKIVPDTKNVVCLKMLPAK
jgi:tRNA(Ile)-lysidine synthase